MKSRILLLFVFLFNSLLSPAQYEVMVSTDYPPYNFLNEDGELVGFNVDLLNAIKELYKIDLKITGSDWQTTNSYLEEGKIDAIAGVHYSGNLDPNFNYTRSVIQTSHCFLYNRKYHNRISVDIIRTIHNPLVVLWDNDVLTHYILSINPNARFIFVDNYEDLIDKLEREDVTCGFSQKYASMYYAEIKERPYILAGNEEILERNMGFKISKDAPQLSEILNNGLEIIMSNDEYQKIYNRWIQKYNTQNNLSHLVKYLVFAAAIVLIIISILLFFNNIQKKNVRSRTRDLQLQLELNTEITKELKKQKIKAEESDKMKSAFLANMSHEIRTPMNGILGFTELLKSRDYSHEEHKQFIDIIQQSGDRMLNTINNIIEISKIESGLESLQIGKTDIEKIVNELLLFFRPEAQKKGIELILEESKINLSQPFYSDSYKINSIITNLIKNALKFTEKGFVKIAYDISDKEVRFRISDSGIGIEKEKQEAIFNYFVQADLSTSSRFEGSGLGLSISKEYTKMLNGEIRIESKIGKGSTFYITIPNRSEKSAKNTETPKEETILETDIPAGLKIIVAEDDKTSFFFLKYILESISANILHAENGIEAVELIKNNPDTNIILMDSKMPEMSGSEAVKQIRKFNKGVYIIAQSAYALESYKAETLKAGCNCYIEKPVNKNKLFQLIAKGISQKQYQEENC